MHKGDIILNHWAGEKNPVRISIVTHIGKKHTQVLYEHNGNLVKGEYYTSDLKNDREHFEIIDRFDYEKQIKDKLKALKRSDNNAE